MRISFYLPKQAIVAGLVLLAMVLAMAGSGQTQAQSAGSRYFTETGHTLQGKFLDYWNTHGGLAQQGFPISDEFMEKSDLNGQMYRVQYFERAVFELHPENAGTPFEVLLSQLGTFRYKAKYGNNPPGTPVSGTPAATGTLTATLTLGGSTVSRGDQQDATVQTSPGASITTACQYADGHSSDDCARAGTGTADSSGKFTFSWTIEPDAAIGPVVVNVQATLGKQQAGTRAKFNIR